MGRASGRRNNCGKEGGGNRAWAKRDGGAKAGYDGKEVGKRGKG